MAKEIILTGKYRLNPGNNPHRLKLIYRKEDYDPNSKPKLELYDGAENPIATYNSNYKGNNPLEDPTNPNNLRVKLKDLSRKLTDSGIFPPEFFSELNVRLEENSWHQNKNKP